MHALPIRPHPTRMPFPPRLQVVHDAHAEQAAGQMDELLGAFSVATFKTRWVGGRLVGGRFAAFKEEVKKV